MNYVICLSIKSLPLLMSQYESLLVTNHFSSDRKNEISHSLFVQHLTPHFGLVDEYPVLLDVL
jgi:hypothetical protein